MVMCFRQGAGGRGEGEAAGCLLLVEVEEEVGEIVLTCIWGMDCIGSQLRLALLLRLLVNAWTLFMSSGLQC